MKSRIMYMENKSTGEAIIGRIMTKNWKTLYYKGKKFTRLNKGGIYGNYYSDKSEHCIPGSCSTMSVGPSLCADSFERIKR
jgi:hypothetical protein